MEEIRNMLLPFQQEYHTGDPGIFGDSKDFMLVYTTSQSLEMYFSILYSGHLRDHLRTKGMQLSYLTFTDKLLIIECAAASC